MSGVIKEVDTSNFDKIIQKAAKIAEKENDKFEQITESASFNLMFGAKKLLDDWFLDPLIGLIPGVGDTIAAIASAPSLYFATFKAKSIRLTMAILFFTIIDWLAGLIPVVGDIVDAFYKSHKKTYRICVGYLEGDPDVLKETNKAAVSLVFLLITIAGILYFAYELVLKIIHWFNP